jgi:hypothetical protein
LLLNAFFCRSHMFFHHFAPFLFVCATSSSYYFTPT